MIIYKLIVNSIADDPMIALSNYISSRTEKKVEYYISGDRAHQRANEIYEGMIKLAGFIPKVEAIVTEIEVIE